MSSAGHLEVMPTYHVHVVNEDFRSSNQSEHADRNTALKAGMRGALAIGTDEICAGKPFFGAEITVLLDGEVLERRVIAIGSSALHGHHSTLKDPLSRRGSW